jgi:hypothetical protein
MILLKARLIFDRRNQDQNKDEYLLEWYRLSRVALFFSDKRIELFGIGDIACLANLPKELSAGSTSFKPASSRTPPSSIPPCWRYNII